MTSQEKMDLKYWDNYVHSTEEIVSLRKLELKEKVLRKSITPEEIEELNLLSK